MALLTSCWFIIEYILIPDGYRKWFYLKFYIHPIFLVFCQIFLWLKELKRWFFIVFFLPFRITRFLVLYIVMFMKRFVACFLYLRPKLEAYNEVFDQETPLVQRENENVIVSYHSFSATCVSYQVHLHKFGSRVSRVEEDYKISPGFNPDEATKNNSQHLWLEEYLSSGQYKYDLDFSDEEGLSRVSSSVTSSMEELEMLDSGNSLASSNRIDFQGFSNHMLDHNEINSSDNCLQTLEGIRLLAEDTTLPSIISPVFNHVAGDFEIRSLDSCSEPLEGTVTSLPQTDGGLDVDMNISSFIQSDCNSPEADLYIDGHVQALSSPDLTVGVLGHHLINREGKEEVDSFYQNYLERINWFDVLNQERLSGLNTILKSEIQDFSIQNISWNKTAKKRLVKSLESDLELVFVAQTCLSWETLHYQYRKVEALTSQNEIFNHSVASEFRRFQIILERFMEDEKGKRYSKYSHTRFSLKSLLQVPEVKGYVEEEGEENDSMGREPIRAVEVLKAIEQCIKSFWSFVKSDKRFSWKPNKSISSIPHVEDPADLELYYGLTKTLKKKALLLKDLHGKKKCWLKRKVTPILEESEKIDLLFTMIDMNLVQRVLKMPIVSTPHLKWCQQKLDNLEFLEGRLFRAQTSHLFPSF